MAERAQPEIIPPRNSQVRRQVSDEQLDVLAGVLDDFLRIPGTNIRFGLDALVGLIPGFGDLLSSMASSLIIFAAWERQVPRVIIARMVANLALDAVVGAVPFLGDVFDVAWKANRKNYGLLQRATAPYGQGGQTWRDWLFLVLVLLAVALLAAIPFVVLIWVVGRIW